MSRGLAAAVPEAKSPAITAAAGDSNASRRFFSSSTKTRAPADAEAMLDTPLTVISPSPCTLADTCSATSWTDRFSVARFIAPFYTFARGKESREIVTLGVMGAPFLRVLCAKVGFHCRLPYGILLQFPTTEQFIPTSPTEASFHSSAHPSRRAILYRGSSVTYIHLNRCHPEAG